MGLFSLFSSDSKSEIETIKKNNANKTQAHYAKSAKEKIETLKYQIKKEKEKIQKLKK